MTRRMYDSTNIQDDPLDAQLVGYYCDGIYATTEVAVKARFPNAVPVPISAVGTNNGIVGDIEPGCMTIAQGIAWVEMRRAAGYDPTLYVNEVYGWGPLQRAFQSAGVNQPHYWVADYDGIPIIPTGAVAKQYENPTLTGGHFDLSVVVDSWPGVDGVYGPGGGGGSGGLSLADAQQIYDELRGNAPHSKLDIIEQELRGDGPYSKLDTLEQQIAAILAKLNTLQGVPGPAGPAGAPGTEGPAGPQGPPGTTPIHDHPLQGFTGKT